MNNGRALAESRLIDHFERLAWGLRLDCIRSRTAPLSHLNLPRNAFRRGKCLIDRIWVVTVRPVMSCLGMDFDGMIRDN